MNLFGNIARAVDGLAEEASKRFQPLAIEAYRHAGRLYQDTREYAAPAAESLWESLDKKGKDAGLDIGAIVEGVLAQANAFADNVPNRAVPAADEAKKYIRVSSEVSTSIQNTDWSSIQDFGIDVGKQVGATADNIWDLMVTGDLLGRLSNEGTMLIQSAQQHLPGAGDRARCWILQHPKEAAALLACIFVPSITLSYTAAVLGLLGFNSEGVAAGSFAAIWQAYQCGFITTGSLLAILQSAGAGGPGLLVVKAIARSTAGAMTCSAAAVNFLEALRKDECGC